MKTIHDGELVLLIREYLVSEVMKIRVVSPTKVWTPQGGNLSSLLSNIMLKRSLNFIRYADACISIVKSEKQRIELWKA